MDNDLACKAWLEKKSEALREINKQRSIAERTEKQKKDEEILEKKKASQTAFEAW